MDYTTPTIRVYDGKGDSVVINEGDKDALDNWNTAGYKSKEQIEAEKKEVKKDK